MAVVADMNSQPTFGGEQRTENGGRRRIDIRMKTTSA